MKELTITENVVTKELSYAKEDEWFYSMSEERQRKYLVNHPHSKFSKNTEVVKKAEETKKNLDVLPGEETVNKMKKAVQGFNEQQKAFFKEGGNHPESEERTQAASYLKRKAKGLVKSLKHEKKEWKLAANALRKLKAGEQLDHHDKAALKSVATHVGIVAGEMLLTGGMAHGVAVALPHLAQGLVTHSLAVSGAKSAIYSATNEQSDDELLMELVQHFIKGVHSAPIKKKDWIEAIDKHNQKSKKGKKNA